MRGKRRATERLWTECRVEPYCKSLNFYKIFSHIFCRVLIAADIGLEEPGEVDAAEQHRGHVEQPVEGIASGQCQPDGSSSA